MIVASTIVPLESRKPSERVNDFDTAGVVI
jgi:hypothetical protein